MNEYGDEEEGMEVGRDANRGDLAPPDAAHERAPMGSPDAVFDSLESAVDADAGNPGFPRLAEAYRRAGQLERAEEVAIAGLAEAPERLGGKVALALILLDKGEIAEAKQALTGILVDVPEVPVGVAAPADDEAVTLDAANDAAEVVEVAEAVEQEGEEVEADDHVDSGFEHRLFAVPLASPSDALPHFDGGAAEAEAPVNELREDEIEDAFAVAEAHPDDVPSAEALVEAAVRGVEATTPDAVDLGPYRPSEHPVFATATMASLLEGQGDRVGADEIRARIGAVLGLRLDDREADEHEEADCGEPAEAEEQAAASSEPVETESAPETLDAASAIESFDQSLATDGPAPHAATRERRQRIIARLEGWLENIRRDPA